MKRFTLFAMLALLAVGLAGGVIGCSNGGADSGDSDSAAADGDASTVQPMSEYRAEANKEITDENAERELTELEAEIEADASTP